VQSDGALLRVRCQVLVQGDELRRFAFRVGLTVVSACLAACAPDRPPPPPIAAVTVPEYQIGPGDSLYVFVWRNPELSLTVPVRPDGRFSMPLVEDVVAIGRTPTELAGDIKRRLATYLKDPAVTVMPVSFIGPFDQQVRVVGEALNPRALPYRANMTVLDAMIQVGGLTKYAAGDRATLIRNAIGNQSSYSLRLDSLINDGEIRYNVALMPGDILIIPQSYF
jgi:polysaccharide biosynthesis/export protein